LHWKTDKHAVKFNLALSLKQTENVLNGKEMRESEMEILLCKTEQIGTEAVGYGRGKSLR